MNRAIGRWLKAGAVLFITVFVIAACEGPAGIPGDPGATGDPGEPGMQGDPGDLATLAILECKATLAILECKATLAILGMTLLPVRFSSPISAPLP